MVRAEVYRSTKVSVGVDDLENLTALIQCHQEVLYEDHDWAFLRQTFPAIPFAAGQRYYDLPADLNFDRIESVALRLNGLPIPLRRGIDFSCYAAFDSDADVRANPAQRWDIRWTGEQEQLEIWPIPPDDVNSIQFTGIRKLRPLIDTDDVADLDDRLITLFVAADVLAHSESPDATAKLRQAQQLYARLKGRSAAARATVRVGMGIPSPRPYRATLIVGGR